MNGLFTWLGRTFGLTFASQKFWAAIAGNATWAGETVTAQRAMTISAVFRAVRLTAETIATLPSGVYEIGPDGRGRRVKQGNVYDLVLRVSPNADETPVEFWEGIVGCMMLIGDGMAEKQFVGDRLVGMTLMDPSRVVVVRDYRGLVYRYTDYEGKIRELLRDQVFHLKGFGFGGDRGMSVVQYGANSLSSTLAADKTAGKMWRSGLSSSGFVETGQVLEEPDRDRLTKILSEYQGTDNAGKLMILEGGMKYTPITINPDDAQLLLSRQFNIEEVGRWFGMPPILLGHAGAGQTMWGSGVEQIIQAWYSLSLRALITRIEKAVAKRIFSPGDALRYYYKINVEGLLRGDSAARAALYSVFAQNGIMTRDEIRDLEDLAPYTLGGADVLTAQVNLTTLDKIGQAMAAGTQDQAVKNALRTWLGIEDITQAQLAALEARVRLIQESRAAPLPLPEPPKAPKAKP